MEKVAGTPKPSPLRRLLAVREAGVIGVLVVMGAALAIFTRGPTGSIFLHSDNLLDVARQFSFVAIMAVGELAVILTAGIDLSVAACLSLSGVVMAKAMVAGSGVGLGIAAGLACALAVGAFNGFLVVRVKLPPFIATLGALSICRGLSYAVSHGHPISDLPDLFSRGIGHDTFLRVPVPVLVMAGATVVAWFLFSRTRWGRYFYAVGGNEQASRFAGVPVDKTKFLAYLFCSLCAGVSAVLMTAWLGTAESAAAVGWELDVIAAAVIGGASLMGGHGTALGALMGAAIMGVLRNGLVLLDCPAYYREVSIGLVIILAVAMDRFRRK